MKERKYILFLSIFVILFFLTGCSLINTSITTTVNSTSETTSISTDISSTEDTTLLEQLTYIYDLAVSTSDFQGTYEEWLETVRGPQGTPGEDGKEVLLQVNEGYIQWKYTGDLVWTNLINLAALAGEDGSDGENGEDGREVQFQVADGYIQWKYIGDSVWINLVDIENLSGTDGEDGLTPSIGENGNWWIGDEDTGIPAFTQVNMDRVGTDGLYFDLVIKNGIAGYEVTGYSGTSSDIVVPNMILGEKVISIKSGALPTSITSLSISSNTMYIPTFQDYTLITTVDFNHAPITQMQSNAFKNCTHLSSIQNYENITIISSYAFYNTGILATNFDFSSIVDIGDHAFYTSNSSYDFDTGVMINEDINRVVLLDKNYVYLPENVKTIGAYAFPSEFSVYWAGTDTVAFTSTLFFTNVKQTSDGYWYVDHNTYAGLLNYEGTLTELTVPSTFDGKSVNLVEPFAFVGDNHIARINLPSSVTTIGGYAFVLMHKFYILTIPSSVVNVSGATFAYWEEDLESSTYGDVPCPVVVFANAQADMNFGSVTDPVTMWDRVAFGYTSSKIEMDDSFVYVNKLISYDILAIKNSTGTVVIPAAFNSLPVSRIQTRALNYSNGGITFIKISSGVKYISQYAFYGSSTLKGLSIPSTVTAVNYQGVYSLSNATIYCQAISKPTDWDSSWYYSIDDVIWNTYVEGLTADEKFIYELVGSSYYIKQFIGIWNASNPIVIPSAINSIPVVGIRSSAIRYNNSGSSTATLKIYIPSSIKTIEPTAIYTYNYTTIYAEAISKPTGWDTNWIYDGYYGTYGIQNYVVANWNVDIMIEGNYEFLVQNNQAYIIRYNGVWEQSTSSTNNAIIVPSTLGNKPVVGIMSGSFMYTSKISSSSSYYHEIIIPSSVTMIEARAFTYYYYCKIYTYVSSMPENWSTYLGYQYSNSSTSTSYRTIYFDGSWTLVGNDPSVN